MSRRDFVLVIVCSSILSAAIVIFAIRWPAPPPVQAEFVQTGARALDTELSEEERVNITVYSEFSRSVLNITSTRLRLNFWMQVVPEQGSGSGFMVDNEGHIVTNNHVIEDSDQVEVTLVDDTTVQATVVGRDALTDIAVLKIPCQQEYCQPLKLSESSVQVGQRVLAIGNPFGLERTLTTGIVSAMGRSLQTGENEVLNDLIQTDAAINPGNSGGPLLNTSGEVIGINTAILSRANQSAGVGFAIPSSTLKRVVPDLIQHGYVIRAWIGILSGRPVGPRLAKVLDLPVEEGFLVEQVARGSSADLAGIRGGDQRVFAGNVPLLIGGDLLVEIDGKPVRRGRDILRLTENKRPGETMEFVVYRKGERVAGKVELVGEDGRGGRLRF